MGQVRADKLQILSPSTFALPSNIMIMTEIENEKEDIFTNNICPSPPALPSSKQPVYRDKVNLFELGNQPDPMCKMNMILLVNYNLL